MNDLKMAELCGLGEKLQEKARPVGAGIRQRPRKSSAEVHITDRPGPQSSLAPDHLLGHPHRRRGLAVVRRLLRRQSLPLRRRHISFRRRRGDRKHRPVPQGRLGGLLLLLHLLVAGDSGDSGEGGGGEAVPLVDGGEDVARSDEAESEGSAEHGLEAGLELGGAVGDAWLLTRGPGGPREGLAGARVVLADALREVHVPGHVRSLVPVAEQTCESEFRERERDDWGFRAYDRG